MAKKEAIKRQFLIIEYLRKKGQSFLNIQQYLNRKSEETGYDLNISKRTFQRDRIEILELWGIETDYNKKNDVYEIIQDDDDLLSNRLMESFDMVSVLNKSKEVANYIYLEKRKSSGISYFNDILHAIKNQLMLTFTLNSYWQEGSQRTCVPKAIKETHNRYYLIAWDLDKNEIRNYGLDRISNFKITQQKIEVPTIDVEHFYENAFGIECYNKPEKVVLRFVHSQKMYLESLPLHHSQKIHIVNDDFIDVELFVHPTNELLMEIMKYGAICEVIQPISLRKQIIDKVTDFYKKYK